MPTLKEYVPGEIYELTYRPGDNNPQERSKEEAAFNLLMQTRQPLHNSPDIDNLIWDNFEICIDTIASKREYRTASNLHLLEYKYFLQATNSFSEYLPEVPNIATPEEVAESIEASSPDNHYYCSNDLQICFAMELHHLRQTNKGGFGEVFRKCENCGRYFITRNEKYCSPDCKAEAKATQMKKVKADPKTRYLRLIRDRYDKRIERAEGNHSLQEKIRAELTDFQKERKRKKKELPEDQYIEWLKQVHDRKE